MVRISNYNRANVPRGLRVPTNDTALAATAPGVRPPNFNMDADINDFYCPFGHVHERFLRETEKQRNVNLIGVL